mmetsp:Transcript_50466/g.141244  ORF Transcript_50466/g.141244 Transcript_50466/m.141244 type:complete len:456 (-) Transcript_50466:66-1433(-)
MVLHSWARPAQRVSVQCRREVLVRRQLFVVAAVLPAMAVLTWVMTDKAIGFSLYRPSSPSPQRWARTLRHARTAESANTVLSDADVPFDWPETRWLPDINVSAPDVEPVGEIDGEAISVLPLFPCGSVACMPHSEHVLNIFEPRYRKLYDDILVSGSRRFVVTAVHPDTGRFAEVGAVFYLEDLRDVSVQSSDQVKYVCTHRVIGRVRIRRFLNPSSWEDESTYLRVETTPLEDVHEGENFEEQEAALMARLQQVVQLQKDLDVVQITPDIAAWRNASRSESGGIWSLADLWAHYFDFLVEEREQILQETMQHKYISYMPDSHVAMESEGMEPDYEEDAGLDLDALEAELEIEDYDDEAAFVGDDIEDELEEIGLFDDLPPVLQGELRRLQDQHDEDCELLLRQQTMMTQQLLTSTSHRERLVLLSDMFGEELRKLRAKKMVLGVFEDKEHAKES